MLLVIQSKIIYTIILNKSVESCLMNPQSEQYRLLKTIIDKELAEIDEELATQDNSDILTVIAFHIEHGLRDVEKRIAENGLTELEFPYTVPEELKASMNRSLLSVEALLQYYYQACYFGTRDEIERYLREIQQQLLRYRAL